MSRARGRYAAFARCDAALAVSGSVTAQLAAARLPCVVAYRAHPLTEVVFTHCYTSARSASADAALPVLCCCCAAAVGGAACCRGAPRVAAQPGAAPRRAAGGGLRRRHARSAGGAPAHAAGRKQRRRPSAAGALSLRCSRQLAIAGSRTHHAFHAAGRCCGISGACRAAAAGCGSFGGCCAAIAAPAAQRCCRCRRAAPRARALRVTLVCHRPRDAWHAHIVRKGCDTEVTHGPCRHLSAPVATPEASSWHDECARCCCCSRLSAAPPPRGWPPGRRARPCAGTAQTCCPRS
jgi:hypothetical protein